MHRHQSRRQRSFTYQNNCTFSPMLKTDEWMAPRAHTANGQRHAPQGHTPLSARIHTYTIQLQQCLFSGYSRLTFRSGVSRFGREIISQIQTGNRFFPKYEFSAKLSMASHLECQYLSCSTSTPINLANSQVKCQLFRGDSLRLHIMGDLCDDFSILDTSTDSLGSNFSESSNLSLKR